MIQLNIINFLDVQQIGLLTEILPTIVLPFENFTYLPLARDKKNRRGYNYEKSPT